MKKTNNHPFTGYKLSQININRRQIMENKQEPKISTGLALHTNLIAGVASSCYTKDKTHTKGQNCMATPP